MATNISGVLYRAIWQFARKIAFAGGYVEGSTRTALQNKLGEVSVSSIGRGHKFILLSGLYDSSQEHKAAIICQHWISGVNIGNKFLRVNLFQ